MKSLADIKRRLASVKQTRQITGAMEMISVAKMRKALERFDSNSVYFDVLFGVMKNIAASADEEIAEFIKPPETGKKLVVVVASDKGLCGSFNHDVFKLADSLIGEDTVMLPIGRLAYEHCVRSGAETDDRFVDAACAPDYRRAKAVSEVLLDMYGTSVKSIRLVYMRLLSHSLWAPQALELLPLSPDSIGEGHSFDTDLSGMEFEPSRLEVFKRLMPLYLSGMIYGALVHSAAAEHGARHAAMAASSKNADEMIDSLSLEYNSARQSAVTEQIIDIIGSAQAIGEV